MSELEIINCLKKIYVNFNDVKISNRIYEPKSQKIVIYEVTDKIDYRYTLGIGYNNCNYTLAIRKYKPNNKIFIIKVTDGCYILINLQLYSTFINIIINDIIYYCTNHSNKISLISYYINQFFNQYYEHWYSEYAFYIPKNIDKFNVNDKLAILEAVLLFND